MSVVALLYVPHQTVEVTTLFGFGGPIKTTQSLGIEYDWCWRGRPLEGVSSTVTSLTERGSVVAWRLLSVQLAVIVLGGGALVGWLERRSSRRLTASG